LQADGRIRRRGGGEGPAEAHAVIVHEGKDAEAGAAGGFVRGVGFDALEEELAGIAGGELGENGLEFAARFRGDVVAGADDELAGVEARLQFDVAIGAEFYGVLEELVRKVGDAVGEVFRLRRTEGGAEEAGVIGAEEIGGGAAVGPTEREVLGTKAQTEMAIEPGGSSIASPIMRVAVCAVMRQPCLMTTRVRSSRRGCEPIWAVTSATMCWRISLAVPFRAAAALAQRASMP
jgi:hypothetical protein